MKSITVNLVFPKKVNCSDSMPGRAIGIYHISISKHCDTGQRITDEAKDGLIQVRNVERTITKANIC